jgi:uncharacterized membrane protein
MAGEANDKNGAAGNTGTVGSAGNAGGDAGNAGANGTGNAGTQDGGTPPATWDEFVVTLPADVQALYNDNVAGLRSALSSERDARKDLTAQLRDAAEKATDDNALKQTVTDLTAKLEEAQKQADFAQVAVQAGITNPGLAWIAANQADAFDRKGNVDMAVLKEQFPELFKVVTPAGNAGAGTGGNAPAPVDMNTLIRRQAGVQG